MTIPTRLRRRASRLAMVPVLVGALALAGCAAGAIDAPGGGKPVVLTTFTVLADIARNVAGDHLTVESITKPGAEIHDYEPTPRDVAKASGAALVLDNGLGLERWFDKFVDQAHAKHVDLSRGVKVIDIAGGEASGEANPHAWMSPLDVKVYVANMVSAFSGIDPEHAADFRANGATYSAKLQAVQDQLVAELSKLPAEQRALVSCEGAFSYLARDAGLTEKYIWPVNAEQEATPQRIASAIDFVKANAVPAVFCESTESDKAMKQVVEATGARFGGDLYVDSLSTAGGPVPTYLDLIRYDATTIATGLTGSRS